MFGWLDFSIETASGLSMPLIYSAKKIRVISCLYRGSSVCLVLVFKVDARGADSYLNSSKRLACLMDKATLKDVYKISVEG